MRRRSVTANIGSPPKLKPTTTGLPRGKGIPDFPKTPRGVYTGDRAVDWRERQAWPKDTRFMEKLASLPERRVIWWLLYRAEPKLEPYRDFEFQPEFLGGRVVRGGLVSDFALYNVVPGQIVLWEVEGTTWHAAGWRQMRDEARKAKLLTFPEVFAVLSLKEIDINHSDESRNQVCEDAMRLIERD